MLGEIRDILGPELHLAPQTGPHDISRYRVMRQGSLVRVDIGDIARAQVWWGLVAQEDLPLLAAGGTPQNISIDHYSYHDSKAHVALCAAAEKFLKDGVDI